MLRSRVFPCCIRMTARVTVGSLRPAEEILHVLCCRWWWPPYRGSEPLQPPEYLRCYTRSRLSFRGKAIGMWLKSAVFAGFLSLGSSVLAATNAEIFEKQLKPLLVANCQSCHSGEEPAGGLKLTTV